jgi:hypothetical protein
MPKTSLRHLATAAHGELACLAPVAGVGDRGVHEAPRAAPHLDPVGGLNTQILQNSLNNACIGLILSK